MPTGKSEPRNPFYVLLLVVGLVFVLTALAYAVVPVLEEKARDQGATPPPSPWRDALRRDGWKWLLVQVGLLVLLGLASMGLDRFRRWQADAANPKPAESAPLPAETPASTDDASRST